MNAIKDSHTNLWFCFKNNNSNQVFDKIIQHGFPEIDLITWCVQFLNKHNSFIDIGAHIGSYSFYLSKFCKEVHSFECASKTQKWLWLGSELNEITNMSIYNCALGAEEVENANLYIKSSDGINSSLILESKETESITVEKVTIKTLDNFKFHNVGLIKIDVNGWELEVIQGSIKTLEKHNYPPILFQVSNNAELIEKKNLLFNFISSLSYCLCPINNTNDMYLASSHPKYRPTTEKKNRRKTENIDKQSEEKKLNQEISEKKPREKKSKTNKKTESVKISLQDII